jgi:hypothetical protein
MDHTVDFTYFTLSHSPCTSLSTLIIIIIIITITGNGGTHDPKPRRTLASRRLSSINTGLPGPWRWSLDWPFRIPLIKSSFNMIDTICNRTYIYNICWEDPAVDQQILKITKDDVIFRICSAGDIVLDYAIEGPAKIVVCDMNQHQLWLFELKIGMLRDPDLTYDEWWAIWGSSDVAVAMKVWKRIRHTLSVPDASGGWTYRTRLSQGSPRPIDGVRGQISHSLAHVRGWL